MNTLRFCEHPELVYVGEKTTVQDVMEELDSLRAEVERLKARDEEWQRKASAWMASPEAAQRLDGYRELAQRLNAAEAERDALRADAERYRKWRHEFREGSCGLWNALCEANSDTEHDAAIDAARGES